MMRLRIISRMGFGVASAADSAAGNRDEPVKGALSGTVSSLNREERNAASERRRVSS